MTQSAKWKKPSTYYSARSETCQIFPWSAFICHHCSFPLPRELIVGLCAFVSGNLAGLYQIFWEDTSHSKTHSPFKAVVLLLKGSVWTQCRRIMGCVQGSGVLPWAFTVTSCSWQQPYRLQKKQKNKNTHTSSPHSKREEMAEEQMLETSFPPQKTQSYISTKKWSLFFNSKCPNAQTA